MSDSRKAFDPRRVVVIDTSPLFNALALMFVKNSPLHRIRLKHRLPDYLRNNPAKESDFLRLFDSIRTLLTTSHVIGEIQGILTTSGLPQREFWDFSMSRLKRKGLDENLITLLDMHETEGMKELICAIGPTDAGLIALAKKIALLKKERAILLTDDRGTLAQHALGMPDIECILVELIL